MTVPGLILLTVLGSTRVLTGETGEEFRRRFRVGAVAGVIGTLGYDVFRIPFAAAGRRVFAPIDSYLDKLMERVQEAIDLCLEDEGPVR